MNNAINALSMSMPRHAGDDLGPQLDRSGLPLTVSSVPQRQAGEVVKHKGARSLPEKPSNDQSIKAATGTVSGQAHRFSLWDLGLLRSAVLIAAGEAVPPSRNSEARDVQAGPRRPHPGRTPQSSRLQDSHEKMTRL